MTILIQYHELGIYIFGPTTKCHIYIYVVVVKNSIIKFYDVRPTIVGT